MFTHFRSDIQLMELMPSSGGAFEVIVNEEKLYSKIETGVFPKAAEIIRQM